ATRLAARSAAKPGKPTLMTRGGPSRSVLIVRSAPGFPAQLRVMLFQVGGGREVAGRERLERLRREAEGQRRAAARDARLLHRAVVVAAHQRAGEALEQRRLQVREAVGKIEDQPAVPAHRARI